MSSLYVERQRIYSAGEDLEIAYQNDTLCFIKSGDGKVVEANTFWEFCKTNENYYTPLVLKYKNIFGMIKCEREMTDSIFCQNHLIVFQNDYKRLEGYDTKTLEKSFFVEFPEPFDSKNVSLFYVENYRNLVTFVQSSGTLCLMGVHKLGQVFPITFKLIDSEYKKLFVLDGYVLLTDDENQQMKAFDPLRNLEEIEIKGYMGGYFESNRTEIFRNVVAYNHPDSFSEEWLEKLKRHNILAAFEYASNSGKSLLQSDFIELKGRITGETIHRVEYLCCIKLETKNIKDMYQEIIRSQLTEGNWFENLRMLEDEMLAPLFLNDPKNSFMRDSRNW